MRAIVKRKSIIIYLIGFIVFYLGMFFKNTTLQFGDCLYWTTRDFTSFDEYILIALGSIIILCEFVRTKAYNKVYQKVFVDKKVSLFEITALVSCLIFLTFPYIPAKALYFVLNTLLILLMVYITIKVDILYIFSIILILVQFSDKIIWFYFESLPTLLIVLAIAFAVNLLVFVDGIIKAIKKKEFLPNFILIYVNIFLVLFMIFVEYSFEFWSSGWKLDEYYYIWLFPICILPLIIIYFTKKSKKIKLFK